LGEPELRRSVKKTLHIAAWAGDLQEARKLVRMVEASAERRRSEELAAFDGQNTAESRAEEARAQVPGHPKDSSHYEEALERERRRVEARVAEERSKIAGSWLVRLRVTDGDDVVEGPPDAIFPEIDRRTVSRISVEAQAGLFTFGDKMQVELSSSSGVLVEVSSTDPGWGRQVFASLAEEAEKGKPRWAWFNTSTGSNVGYGTTFLSLYVLLAIFLRPVGLSSGVIWLIALVAGTASVAVWMTRVQHWFFPPLDIVPEGAEPRGTRRWIVAVGWFVTIIIGVITNIVT